MLGRCCFLNPHTPILILLIGTLQIAAASGNLLWAEAGGVGLENAAVVPEEFEMQQARLLAEERDLMEQISRQANGDFTKEPQPVLTQKPIKIITPSHKKIAPQEPQLKATPIPKAKGISSKKLKPAMIARAAAASKEVVATASPLPAKRYEDSWRKEDQVQPENMREPEKIARVEDLERTVGALRLENMQIRESFRELESRFQALQSAQVVREEPRARFAPSVEGLQENGGDCDRLGCERKIATTATVAADRVILRAGPTQVSMRITTLERGERLTVELIRGDWLRVVVASGVRAWLPASAVVLD